MRFGGNDFDWYQNIRQQAKVATEYKKAFEAWGFKVKDSWHKPGEAMLKVGAARGDR